MREEAHAGTAYFAAQQRLTQAFAALLAVGVPLDPGRGGQVREWSRTDVTVLRELHTALGEVLDKRRSWDRMRRGNGGDPRR